MKKFLEKNKSFSKKGFILLELIVYISLSAIVFLSLSTFVSAVFQTRIKNKTITEVEQQGLNVLQIMTREIRNAEMIVTPDEGLSADSLTLQSGNQEIDQVIFSLDAGAIKIQENNNQPILLTNYLVTVSNLNFQNLSRSLTPGTIRVSFDLSYNNQSERGEYNYKKTFYGSASLR